MKYSNSIQVDISSEYRHHEDPNIAPTIDSCVSAPTLIPSSTTVQLKLLLTYLFYSTKVNMVILMLMSFTAF